MVVPSKRRTALVLIYLELASYKENLLSFKNQSCLKYTFLKTLFNFRFKKTKAVSFVSYEVPLGSEGRYWVQM